jgi:hypothetical protein
MISLVPKLFKMLQYYRNYHSPAKSWTLPSYAEKIAKLQALQTFPSLQSNASPKYNPRVLKLLDVAADVDFDIDLTNTQANPSDFVSGSISLSTSFVGNGLIYVDDEAIS